MNCKSAEKQIYIYHELSGGEKKALDVHVASCPSCRALLEQWERRAPEIRNALDVEYQPRNQAALTGRIMQAVRRAEKSHGLELDLNTGWVFVKRLRQGMVTVSLCVLLAFLYEFNSTPVVGKKSEYVGADVKLNFPSYLKPFSKGTGVRDESRNYRCVMDCLRAHDEICADCKNEIIRKIKQYEEG